MMDDGAGGAMAALREASRRLDDRRPGPDVAEETDATVDAERFEALHEALTAVLAELDRS